MADIAAGVQKVTEAPTAKAAAKQEKMLQRLTAKVQDGTWANRLRAVTLEQWRDKMLNVGVPRISAGIEANRAKVAEFARQLLAYQDNLQNKIKSMPDLTLEQNIQRMTEWVKGMAQFKRK